VRRALFGIGSAAAALALVAAPNTGARDAKPKPHGNNFWSNCRYSHTAPDDPIVYPGERGRSHSHTFFGNTTTNAASTLATLGRAATTCTPRADKAAYWVPTLFQDGREVRPAKAQLYYIVFGLDHMRAFPPGLRVIAGDAHATRPQSTRVTYWSCGGRAARSAPSATIPARCGVIEGRGHALDPRTGKTRIVRWRTKTSLELHVEFPDCWDGKRLDSPDHRSHMAYSRDYACPRSHPVKVPRLQLIIRYPIDSRKGVSLASGSEFSAHADFFNAWNQAALETLVQNCLNALRHCQRGD
jgi:hypothetical protein